ncbi:MAG: Xaa-Pro peptidase family protein [Planctomycetota bacterium]
MTQLPPAIGGPEHRARLAKAQSLMAEHGVHAVVLTAGTSLRYFTGLVWGLSERLLAAVVPREGDPVYVVPAFEEPKVRELLVVEGEVRGWEEHESPFALVARQLVDAPRGGGRLAIEATAPLFMAEGLRDAASGWEVTSAAPIVDACRMHKSPAEIAIIRYAMGVTLDIHQRVRDELYPGISNVEVVERIDRLHRQAGSDSGSTFAIVAFGESTAFPHGPKGEQRLQAGETVLVDTGCTFHGYHSDLTRTYVFGEPTPRQREFWDIERDAQLAAFNAARLGAPCEAVDAAARAVLQKRGLGPGYQTPGLPHRTGHGLGLDIHEPPYLVKGNTTPLAEGMVASIEPMIVSYGEMGVRLEDHFVMTDAGPRWVTEPSPSLGSPFGG